MKKETIFKVIRYAGTILGVFNLIMFFAMRPCWSGISSTLGYSGGTNKFLYYFPILLCVLFFLVVIADLVLKAVFNKNWMQITFLAIDFVFFICIIVIIIMGAQDYMRFVWPKFLLGLAAAIVLLAIYFVLFVYPKTILKDNKIFKFGILGLSGAIAISLLLHFSINRISYKPVVYAVEDDYQIVFSTNSESVGWVKIGEKCYYDTYAGTSKKFTKVHKVEVPMEDLNNAKKYEIHAQKSIYCGPFGGFLGRELVQSIEFKPVDASDGIQYLSFSDIHMNDWQTEKTASYVEKYDFLVLVGDAISDVETFSDANFINKVANKITGGSIPVVYARGNHDVKGRYAEETHKYTGAKGEKFFYNFYFGHDVYGVVLDIGEDHDDDWWEYYGTAHYEDYQQEQVEFLKEEILKHEYDGYKYRMVACHIPIVFVNKRLNQKELKAELTSLLNQMDIDMLVCGHQHDLMIFEPGLVTPNETLTYNSEYLENKTYKGYLTEFNFPSFMVSKPGFTFKDEPGLSHSKSQIGLFVDVDLINNKETCYYLNSKGEKVDLMNMWAEKHYGTEITIDLTTNIFSSK